MSSTSHEVNIVLVGDAGVGKVAEIARIARLLLIPTRAASLENIKLVNFLMTTHLLWIFSHLISRGTRYDTKLVETTQWPRETDGENIDCWVFKRDCVGGSYYQRGIP